MRRRKEASQRERGEWVETRVLRDVFVQPSDNTQVNEHQKDAVPVMSESMGGACKDAWRG